ncbi:unnamed protein product [Closterium sp. Naga37s-1]|nr:unnamed protein product [Closterium sp. Naga37s-1]
MQLWMWINSCSFSFSSPSSPSGFPIPSASPPRLAPRGSPRGASRGAGPGAHRVLRTSLSVRCRADVLRPRHPGAHVACGEAPVTRTESRAFSGNEGETEGGRAFGEEAWQTDGCRAVPEQRTQSSSCTAADEQVGSSGAAGRTRVTIRLEQPVPRGLYADPFELERILRPAGDRAWVAGPLELEQPAPRCEATVAFMERDVPVGTGEGDARMGEGREGGVNAGEDEVAFSVDFSLPLHSRYPQLQRENQTERGWEQQGWEETRRKRKQQQQRKCTTRREGRRGGEGALQWEVPAGCAAHTPLVLWGTSLASAVGALVLVAVAAAAPVHTAGAKASS